MSLCFLSVKIARVLKMLVFFFPNFWGFVGWLIVVHLGLEGLVVLVFLVFVSLFGVGFVSVLFALLLVLWLDVVVFAFFFWFVLLFFLFCFSFFGGFKGQVRWPKGPPHLALNPPFSLFFVCLFFFCFCFPFFVLNRKKNLFPPPPRKKAISVYLSVFPFVSLWPF